MVAIASLMVSPAADATTCTARLVRLDSPPGVYRYRTVIESTGFPPFSYAAMYVPGFGPVRSDCRIGQTTCTHEMQLSCLVAGTHKIRAYGFTDWPGDAMFCETAPVTLEAEPQAPQVSIGGQLDAAGRYTVTVNYTAAAERNVARVVFERMNANGTFSPFLTRFVEIRPEGSVTAVLFHALPAAPITLRAAAYHDCSNDLPGYSGVIRTPFAPPQTPRFEFELSDAHPLQRMLIQKHRTDEPYPSPWQIEPDPGSGRPRFRFNGVVKVNGVGASGRNVWLRVIDPADPSDYIPLAQRTAGDNKDPLPKGTLMPEGCTNCGTSGGTPLQVTSGAGGAVSVILEGTARHAGDNYQIEASLDPNFACASAGANGSNICPRSVLVTAWKRVYVETSPMFRRGAFLARELMPDGQQIFVDDVHRHFGPVGTRHLVRLLHARPIRAGAAPTPALDEFYSEDHEVEVIAENRQTNTPAHLALLGDDRIARHYVFDRSGRRDDERPLLRDAVAILGIHDTFAPSFGSVDAAGDSELDRFFASMFVELRAVPGNGYVPAIEFMQLSNGFAGEVARRVSDKWSRAVVRRNADDRAVALPNHIRLCGGNRPHTRPVQEQPQSEIGVTDVSHDGNASWSWVGNIERLTGSLFGPLRGLHPERVNYENVAHELVHQWNVNIPSPSPPSDPPLPPPFGEQPPHATRGHCSFAAAGPDGAAKLCRLHRPWTENAHRLERGDGIVELHYELIDGRPHSEYLAVRHAAEPKPNLYVP